MLAAPRLGDPNFERTVVLLGRHDEEGALGWVLNGHVLGRAAALLASTDVAARRSGRVVRTAGFETMARRGGPVQTSSGWLLYRSADVGALLPGSIDVGTQLAITGDVEAFARLFSGEGPEDFRLLLGYAGWGPGQLEGEVRDGAWLPAPADAELLWRTAADSLWDEAYRATIGTLPGAFVSSTRGRA